ncbi:MAG TPA: glycosyl hydrolase family 65 protein [Tepidisphaeraceae bacterium]|nr:glycosyl hydrolase family 65 protein [Tepidisphaeraceae bacterium]
MLNPEDYKHYVDAFNALDAAEDVVNLIPNASTWQWMCQNVPLFECPDPDIQRIYWYRWWTYRKHIKQTPAGIIITEFILPVRHAGMYNSISCALGHHLAEGRWLGNEKLYLDQYVRFWFTADNGRPEPRFHNYSSWLAAALLERCLVSGDRSFLVELLDELIRDYQRWEAERLLPSGLFWQYDVRDGMEESISGSRTHRNFRPTINSYMYGNALALAQIASWAGRSDIVEQFRDKALTLKQLVLQTLWDPQAQFFKAQTQENGLCDAREAIGFIPWCFRLPDPNCGYEQAWQQLVDPQGFWAPYGITTAERRHPRFRSHGVGRCEWDGAVWPFATSQTLNALANVLRSYPQPHVTRQHYLQAMQVYARCHQYDGKPYIGEYLDETTGAWLKGDNPRSRFYNHSTFCDLVITGLVGLVPRADEIVEISPLLPSDSWDWFCLDNVRYHGRTLTIFWDRTGRRYGRQAGLHVLCDGQTIAHSQTLAPLTGTLPGKSS